MKTLEDYSINIVMYHYVRPIKGSKHPNIKGLELENFKKQINFFLKKTNIISQTDLIEIIGSKKIPKKPNIMLTFDDGFIDHYKYVFPHLLKKKIHACFYPPIQAIKNKSVLEIDKLLIQKKKN